MTPAKIVRNLQCSGTTEKNADKATEKNCHLKILILIYKYIHSSSSISLCT